MSELSLTTRYLLLIAEMKLLVINDLKKLNKGYCKSKKSISSSTKIPIDILTIILRELKYNGEIELMCIFSEKTGLAAGSGYCITGNLAY